MASRPWFSHFLCGYNTRKCFINLGIRNIRWHYHYFTVPVSPFLFLSTSLPLFCWLPNNTWHPTGFSQSTNFSVIAAFLTVRPLPLSCSSLFRTEMTTRFQVAFFHIRELWGSTWLASEMAPLVINELCRVSGRATSLLTLHWGWGRCCVSPSRAQPACTRRCSS